MGMKFEDRIVVFIDILGFGGLVEEAAKDPKGDASDRLENALDIIQNLAIKTSKERSAKTSEGRSLLQKADPSIQIFSDSVILSISPMSSELKNLFLELSRLFVRLMIEGVWIRGGISYGKLSVPRKKPCGPAVNSAYQIESKVAGFPRLALSASMVNFCRENDPGILDSQYVLRDEDGVYAVSPLKCATEQHEEFGFDIRDHAKVIRDQLDKALQKIVDRPDQFKKVEKLSDRWNEIADRKKGFFTESYRTKGYVDLVDVFESALNEDL
jgi:hypothetical protein